LLKDILMASESSEIVTVLTANSWTAVSVHAQYKSGQNSTETLPNRQISLTSQRKKN